jgi:hypothetical protein
MATTTNYSWTTPDDTDLVKDGAAAIRTLGSSADTTVKDLNPGTTAGDIDYYTSSTAKARVAIGTAGQVLKVNSGGTAPEWATTADQTPLTTKGDVFTFSTEDARIGVGADGTVLTANSSEPTGLEWATPSDQTPLTTKGDVFTFSTVDARIGVGANGTVLTADSAETTGLKWAAPAGGALVYVGGTTFTTSATVNVNDVFSATYANYVIICDMVASTGVSNSLRFRVSGADDTTSNYFGQTLYVANTTVGASQTLSQNSARIIDANAGSNSFYANVTSPFETAKTQIYAYGIFSGSTSSMELQNKQITFNDTTSFTGFTIFPSTGTLTGTIRVYGLANS